MCPYFQNKSSNGRPKLCEEDDCHEKAVDVNHPVLLSQCAAARTEGHDEDDAAEDNEEDGDVEVGAVEEVEIMSGPDLDVGPEPHYGEAGQGEQEVEHQEEILDTAVAGTLHSARNIQTKAKLVKMTE